MFLTPLIEKGDIITGINLIIMLHYERINHMHCKCCTVGMFNLLKAVKANQYGMCSDQATKSKFKSMPPMGSLRPRLILVSLAQMLSSQRQRLNFDKTVGALVDLLLLAIMCCKPYQNGA